MSLATWYDSFNYQLEVTATATRAVLGHLSF